MVATELKLLIKVGHVIVGMGVNANTDVSDRVKCPTADNIVSVPNSSLFMAS